MGEHRMPRDLNPATEEAFKITEVATGQSFALREASDEQLNKHLILANEQHKLLTRQAMQMIGQSVNAAQMAATISYEIDRRSRQIIKILQ